MWVLNNDGIEFKNINCHKVTWDELLEKMSIHSHVNNSSSSLAKCKEEYRFFHHFTQYCINNNQLLFLKKAFYFITKFRREIDEWPTSWDEYTMLMARRQHINKLIGSRGFRYLIREIEKLVVITRNESRGKNCVNMSKCSARVDEFVETNIIPELTHRFSEETMEKNIRFLKQQTQWQCFVCFNINHITLDVCQHCTNTHKTRKYCVSLNPYQFFIYNDSSLLDIDKQFGLIGHLPTINKMKNSTRDTIYSYSDDIYNNGSYIHSNYESNIIGIIVHLGDSLRYCIVFYKNNALTLGQLKTIIYEMAVSPYGKFCQLLHVSLYVQSQTFGKMKDDDIIQQTSNAKPYFVKVVDDVEINYKIRDEYMIHFGGKYCNYQCPYMKSALRKGKVKDDDKSIIINSTVILDPFIHCPYFGDKCDGDNNDEFVLDHLSSYDHFQSFGIVQKHCNLGNSCPKYQRVSKAQDSGLQNTHSSFLDKKHLYLCHHRVADARISNLVANSVNGNWYEYTSSMRAIAKLCRNRVKLYNYESNFGSSAFLIALKLIREVVMNGYIQDLLPKTEISPEFGDKEWMLCALNEMINNYQRHLNQLQGQSMRKKLDTNVKLQIEYKTILSNTFGIFDKLKIKMKHSRHKKMGYPLNEAKLLSLLLYCDGQCNYSLCESQRDGTFEQKWKMFDCLVNGAITTLSSFEKHHENIYTGICNAFYKFQNIVDVVYFTTNVSFTQDLNVAKQFRGSSGMIIGLNLQRSYSFAYELFFACDVSWISKFPHEREVLCSRGSEIRFYKNKMTPTQNDNGDKQQWFVCDEGNLQETSFQSMFGTTK